MPSLTPGASKISMGRQGARPTGEGRGDKPGFSHFAYHSFPLLAMLGLIDMYDCIDDGMSEFDLLYVSSFFPNWSNDSLASFLNPESGLFANTAAALAQPLDCIAATTTQSSINSLFWVSGCWGSHFPLTGHTDGRLASPIRATSLRTSRALFMLHRIGLTRRQGGTDAVCDPQLEPIMSKSFYRKQQFWPMPEVDSGFTNPSGLGSSDSPFTLGSLQPTCCHALGASTLTHGEWRRIPVTGEAAHVHLVWRWVDCCVGVCI